MERLPRVIVVALAVLGLGASAAPGASVRAAKATKCPAVPAASRVAVQLQVTGVSCAQGRKVAARVVRRAPSGCVKVTDEQHHVALVKPCTRLSYRCTGRSIAARLALSVTCKRGTRVVRFQY
jgi:hypothetical protein